MTASKVQLLIFGDQTENPFQQILELSRDAKNSSLLENFFRLCSAALIKEISMLSMVEREQFPRFSTIIELTKAHQQQGSYDAVISGVLMCLTQLGCFIRYAETTPHVYLSSDHVYVGLSTGLISAAAIACSKSLSHLLEVAVEVVCVCFRAGLIARRRAQQLEQETDIKNSWSILVEGVSPSETKSSIKAVHQRQNIVPSKQAYISAESDSSVTISGPPSTLKLLFSKSETLANYKHTPISIGGVYHAGHLGAVDTLDIIGGQLHSSTYSANERVHSTRHGKCFSATDLRDLLVEVIEDLLLEPVRWNQVFSEIIVRLTSAGCTEIDILPFGPTSASKDLAKSLGEAGITAHIKSTGGSRPISSGNFRKGAIAIVGMGGRFPGGESLEEFWKTLMDGLDLHKEVPSDRFDVKTHCDPTGTVRNSTLTPYGCFLDRPGLFDITLFNMTPREATQTDPQHRLALMTAYEALEMAGYAPNRTPSTASHRIGTFFGQTSDDWREVNTGQDVDTYYITGGIRAFAPGRLNYFFKWEGPSYSIDTACSSSSASMQLAYSALVNYECDTAVAGGLSLLTAPDPFAGLSRASFLSKTGSCKTFDADADGYCRGDGVACVVMKRLEDAIADNDNIQAVLLGAVTNHSAEAISITHPHAGTQQRLFRKLLNHTVLHPNDIDYVELHGTGTQSGDAIETRAVTAVFAKNRGPEIPLFIGSVKANIGHGEGVSGVTAMIKAILMLQNSMIPPHVGIKNRINPKLPPFDALNVRIAMRATEFKPRTGNSKRRIVLNNFNAAGGNTSLLIEDPPVHIVEGVDPRTVHIVTVSAKSPFSFKANAERLLAYIRKHPDSSLGDISYTTTARRMHHVYRAAFTVSTITELLASLEKLIASTAAPIKTSPASVAFIFTGQGSHYLKMGKELFDNCFTFRRDILEYDNICQRQDLPSFKALIDGSVESLEVLSPIQVELALISIELALANLCLALGFKPTVVVGHSHGEYAALCVAGVLSVNDAIYLVGKRASLLATMCNRGSHAMLAVMLDAVTIKKDLVETGSPCEIACFNSPQSTVISGCAPDITSLVTYYKSKEVKTVQLQIPFAFHSSQLEAIMKDFRIVTEGVSFGKPIIPVASTLLGRIVKQEGIFTAEHLCRHARESVKFLGTIEECKATGIIDDRTIWIEIGPSPVCLSMVKSILKVPPSLAVHTLKKGESSLAAIANCISKVYAAGVDVNWMAYHREYESAHRLLPLPTYAFDLKNYWIQYEGDWCLRKNVASSPELVQALVPTFFGTTTLQRIERENFDSSGANVLFASDFTEPKLRDMVLQHRVNGIGLCPCSVFADMAFTAAKYIQKRCDQSTPTPPMDVMHMEALETFTEKDCIDRPLIYISANRKTGSNTVELAFISEEGTTKKTYATCTVQYGDGAEWMADWKRYAYLVQSRMDHIVKAAESGKSHRLLKAMAYKLFSALVRYSDNYRGIEEVWMDTNTLEATASIQFQTTVDGGSFEYSPYWIDSIVHLSGCLLTSADIAQPGYIYTSNSWKSLRIVGNLSADKSYRSYVHMQPINNNNVLSGDVYLFDENKVVAVCGGVKFFPVHRSVLDYLLPSTNSKIAVRKPQTVSDEKISSEPRLKSTSVIDSDTLLIDDILEIISSETRVERAELRDDINLIDLGVDSLLTISILARLHQLTNMDVPTSLFQTHPTVGDLRKFYSVDRSIEFKASSAPAQSFVASKSVATNSSSPAVADMVDIIRSIIASEIGCEKAEILPTTVLGDLKIDYLMSVSIVNAIRSKTGMNIPAAFFCDQLTLLDVSKKLEITPTVPTSNLRKQSTSVFLQGSSTSLPPLFLLPDGSGSASSYVPLPMFDNAMIIYGLNSPFLNCPYEFTCKVEELAGIYLTEIRKRQPSGPYILGGWSAGGILAYEAATQLLASGERVLGLIFIDSPCPVTLPPFPFEYIDFLDSIGIFDNIHQGSSSIPAAIKDHFRACLTNVMQYTAKPMDPSKAPKAVAIWAKEGVLESISYEHSEIPKDEGTNNLKDWLLESRKDYGPGGWENLLPSVECVVIPGNHFTIMRQPHVINLAKQIEQAVVKIMKIN